MILKEKETLRLIVILFGIFLFLFAAITFISRHRFAPGEGLSESVAHEAIVQFLTKAETKNALGVDLHAEIPADRVAYNTQSLGHLVLKNLENNLKQVTLRVTVKPAELSSSVFWSDAWPKTLSLAPGEEKKIPFTFLVDKEKFKTQDGNLVFLFTY